MKKVFATLFMSLLSVSAFSVENVRLEVGNRGLSTLILNEIQEDRNLIDKDQVLGEYQMKYEYRGESVSATNVNSEGILSNEKTIQWAQDDPLSVSETFEADGSGLEWTITVSNNTSETIHLTDFALRLPVASISRDYTAKQNFQRHPSVNKSASYIYWSAFDGLGKCLLLMPSTAVGFEYTTPGDWFYLYSSTSVNRTDETWSIPSSSKTLQPKESFSVSFRFSVVEGQKHIEEALYQGGGVNFRVAPGMVIPRGQEVRVALRSKEDFHHFEPQYPASTTLSEPVASSMGFSVITASFDKLGENNIFLDYGDGRMMCLEFFVTESFETLIKKRADFIMRNQQHTDTTKWYNGLYSIYDMKLEKLLSPDDMGEIREPFIVGGSDDPSNSKPIYESEKNVAYPNAEEIASLEYYEENFVWGKLQRTDKEYPYPWGIYGSENWYENRSGQIAGYNSGGWGKERMWRTFDYVTHIAIYYNLYLIARDNPSLVHYLDKAGYLDRAYHTALAYFEVPYNIYMGERWAFHGWCDWAYKQGNFHERYILDLIAALEENGRQTEADKLRREWEKKVTYMIYEEEWPFGSEMFVDRTAFESSYYVGEYALTHDMVPQEQFWYDKNRQCWYSYTEYPRQPMIEFMENQLRSNLTLRGIYEPAYYNCGAAWAINHNLDYMSQMGGVAILDYAVRFSDSPADLVRYGYNSLLSSWALMNTGDASTDYGYWYHGQKNDGGAGWSFSIFQDGRDWGGYMPLRRGSWRIDGDIDHGFTGGVHGAGCYLVDDPVFGEIAYGGDLTSQSDRWEVTLLDGVRRYVSIPQKGRFEMKLLCNGLSSNHPFVVSKDLSQIEFYIERRCESSIQRIHLKGLPQGDYQVVQGKKTLARFSSEDDEVTFSLGNLKKPFRIERR